MIHRTGQNISGKCRGNCCARSSDVECGSLRILIFRRQRIREYPVECTRCIGSRRRIADIQGKSDAIKTLSGNRIRAFRNRRRRFCHVQFFLGSLLYIINSSPGLEFQLPHIAQGSSGRYIGFVQYDDIEKQGVCFFHSAAESRVVDRTQSKVYGSDCGCAAGRNDKTVRYGYRRIYSRSIDAPRIEGTAQVFGTSLQFCRTRNKFSPGLIRRNIAETVA